MDPVVSAGIGGSRTFNALAARRWRDRHGAPQAPRSTQSLTPSQTRRASRSVERQVFASTRRSTVSPFLPADSNERVLVITLIVAGAALRLWQYLAGSSLSIDEAALALNIIHRPLPELFRSLDYAQVAPPGFLAIEKAMVAIFGSSEYTLRLFPLISGLGALGIFLAVARRTLAGWSVAFAVGLFALGVPFIYFASQVKQYSSDIALALLLLLLALDIYARGIHTSRMLLIAVTGAVAVWMSQTVLFVMAGIAVAFLVLYRKQEVGVRNRLLMGLSVWVLSGSAAALLAFSNLSSLDREYFKAFWRVGFMPFPPERVWDFLWIPQQLTWVFGAFGTGLGYLHGGLSYRWSPLFTAIMIFGLWGLWQTRREVALFLSLPVLATFVASAARLYPFSARLVSFLIPFMLICVAAGTHRLIKCLPHRVEFLNPVALAILGGAPLYTIAFALPPSRIQHLRPPLERLAERRQAGDLVYVYSGAELAFRYYAERMKLPLDDVIFGKCAIGNPRAYLAELDRLRGRRAWVVITHEQVPGERELIQEYLNRIGTELEVTDGSTKYRPMERASVHLYDLTRPASNVDANTFELPSTIKPPPDGLLKWGCYGVTGGNRDADRFKTSRSP
jgi:hypothetical protein